MDWFEIGCIGGLVAAIATFLAAHPKVRRHMVAKVKRHRGLLDAFVDSVIDDTIEDLGIEVSEETDKLIKDKMAKMAIELGIDLASPHAKEWAKKTYRELVEEILSGMESHDNLDDKEKEE